MVLNESPVKPPKVIFRKRKKWKNIRISEPTYDFLIQVQIMLKINGLDSLPDNITEGIESLTYGNIILMGIRAVKELSKYV